MAHNAGIVRRQPGFTLVEVMVGIAVGLLAALVVLRSFSAGENFRRYLTGTADATQTSALAGARLNMLLEDAGSGLVQGRHVWGCRLLVSRNGVGLLPVPAHPAPFAAFPGTLRVLPVAVLDGREGSDTLLVISASSASGNRDVPFDFNGTTLSVNNPNGIGLAPAPGADDLLLVVPQEVSGDAPDCRVVQVAPTSGGGTPVLNGVLELRTMPSAVQIALPRAYTSIDLNLSAQSYGSLDVVGGSPSFFHLGREASPVLSLVTVNSMAELVEYDLLQRRKPQSFGENVVLLKIRYGLDNGQGGFPNDGVIDQWVSPGEPGWTLAELMDGKGATEQKIDQIKALRVGLIVRSSQSADAMVRVSRLTLFDDLQSTRRFSRELTEDEQGYTYQVFDWVIPLRNMKSSPKS